MGGFHFVLTCSLCYVDGGRKKERKIAEFGPLGSSSQANIFLTASFTFIYILFHPQVTRRLLHRPLLVYRMPNLLCIDGIPVSNDEKNKAELYFLEQQVCCLFRATATNSRRLPHSCQMFVLLTSRLGYTGILVSAWPSGLEHWCCNPEVLGSRPPPCH